MKHKIKNTIFKNLRKVIVPLVFCTTLFGYAKDVSHFDVQKPFVYEFTQEQINDISKFNNEFNKKKDKNLDIQLSCENQIDETKNLNTNKISLTNKSKQIYNYFDKNKESLKEKGLNSKVLANSLSKTLFDNYDDISKIIKKRDYSINPLLVVKIIETETNGEFGKESSRGALSSLQCYKNGAFADFFMGKYEKYNLYGKIYSKNIEDILGEELFKFNKPNSKQREDLRKSLNENWKKLKQEYSLNYLIRENIFKLCKYSVDKINLTSKMNNEVLDSYLSSFRKNLHLNNPSEKFLREVGVMYLDYLYCIYKGDLRKISQAYNAGQGAVLDGSANEFVETLNYVDKMKSYNLAIGENLNNKENNNAKTL